MRESEQSPLTCDEFTTGMQSEAPCAQEPAVPAKLCQDVTELGLIFIPSIVSV